MSASVQFDIIVSEIEDLARKYPDIVQEETERVMGRIVARMEAETVERTPRGVGGGAGLAGSVFGEVETLGGMVVGTWGTPLEYGLVVEKGRRPGQRMPPVGPIALWAQRKLGIPADEAQGVGFAIARKIAIHGFEGAHMFEKAWTENVRWVMDELGSIAQAVERRLAHGAE